MDVKALKASIIEALEYKSDEQRREFAAVYYPSSLHILGCTNPGMQEVYKIHLTDFKTLEAEQQWELAFELIDARIFEAQQLAFIFIHGSAIAMKSMDANRLDRLGTELDNWVSVDSYSVWFSGFAWRTGIISDEDVLAWTQDKNFWVRRKALVSTVALNQKSHGGKGDIPRTLMICETLVHDRHDMIVKAMSWALRELTKRNKDVVVQFLDKHRQVLAKRVIREVSTKLETGRKKA